MSARQMVVLVSVGVACVIAVNITSYTRQSAFDGTIFTDALLWNLQTRSRLDCASECGRRSDCVMFTFTEMTQTAMTCRGHSNTSENLTSWLLAPNTRLYEIREIAQAAAATGLYLGSQWLTTPCTSNFNCTATDAVCFQNQCLCTPGYYFYQDLDECITDCPDSKLQPEMVMYPKRYISSNNLDDNKTLTRQQCESWCVTTPQCRSYEYNFDTQGCYIASVTPLDVPSAWRTATANLSYYQKTCIS